MDRTEHLRWAKDRALEYVEAGDLVNAFGSLTSDLGKHQELVDAAALNAELGGMQFLAGHLSTPGAMRDWIEGFN